MGLQKRAVVRREQPPWAMASVRPSWPGADLRLERHRQLGRSFHHPLHQLGDGRDIGSIDFQHQLVVDLQNQLRPQHRSISSSSTRIIAIFMISEALPCNGMLTAIRSAAARRE